jgi:hypothetical protein
MTQDTTTPAAAQQQTPAPPNTVTLTIDGQQVTVGQDLKAGAVMIVAKRRVQTGAADFLGRRPIRRHGKHAALAVVRAVLIGVEGHRLRELLHPGKHSWNCARPRLRCGTRRLHNAEADLV